ncbi:MAG: ABC transporter permease [Eubacteriales bacterium]|nr:ABC transporter permease [Eubacteriales bacterium]
MRVKKKGEKLNFAEFYSKYGIALILIVLVVVASLLSPAFLTAKNLINVIRQVVVTMLVACGAQYVLLAGHVDLSPGAVLAFCGCTCTLVMIKTGSVALGIVVALAMGLLFGLLNGILTTVFNVPSFIITLATQQAARGFCLLLTGGTAISVAAISDQFSWIGQGYIGFVPTPVIIMLIIVIISWFILNKLPYGRYLYATGGNLSAARASGINTKSTIVKAFVFQGLLAALAGIVLMSRMNSGQPAAGDGMEFDAITAVIVGGTSMSGGVGNIYGTIIGAVFIGVLNNIMNLANVNAYWQQIVQGLVIAIAVIIDARVRSSKKSV